MSHERPTFVVSLALPDPSAPNDALLELLAGARVRLLGTYVVSDQMTPEQARDEFEEDARETLADYEESFREIGQFVDSQLVFTRDPAETLSRVEDEYDYDAIVIPGSLDGLQRVLVALSGDVDFGRVVDCVGHMMRDRELAITLLNMEASEEDVEEKELMLTGLKEKLVERGVPEESMELASASSSDPVDATQEIAEQYDLVILAEREENIIQSLFGKAWRLVADEFHGPAVIVRLG